MSDAFDLHGTEAQRELARRTLTVRCDYPWARLLPGLRAATGRETIPVEWADLSRWAGAITAEGHAHVHEDGDTAHVLEARARVLGLAWYSGRVQVEATLTGDVAAEVLLSEAAHMVDFFALTDPQRVAVWNALHGPGHRLPEDADVTDAVDLGHGHGWFDVGPYGAWIGEALMEAFVRAFSDVPVTIALGHPTDAAAAAQVRTALLADRPPYFGIDGSPVYHDSHRGIDRDAEWWTRPPDRRPCGTCRP